MPTERDIEAKFWRALRSDMTVMLGLVTPAGPGHTRPMTACLPDDKDHGPLWFFTAADTTMAQALDGTQPAHATFASKGHDVWAAFEGTLTDDTANRAMIAKLWNPFIAAWYEDGQDDPRLRLLRFDAGHAQIWLDASSFLSGLKILMGSDPKEDYAEKVAEVRLDD